METRAMRFAIVAFALGALVAGAGCGPRPHPESSQRPGEPGVPPHEFHQINANSFFGSVDVKEMVGLCSGRVQLAQGAATINDTCFTGDTNVVLCTDSSSPNPVQCAASNGKLILAGTGSDLINYARVR
jgi:hypothetical protein